MISEILAEHPWLWPLAWQSTLCLAAGLGGSFLLRRHAVRAHQVLLLGLVAAVLIPALSQIVKRNQWGLLVAERAVATPQRPPVARTNRLCDSRPAHGDEPASVPPPTGARGGAPASRTRDLTGRGRSCRLGWRSVRFCSCGWPSNSCSAGVWRNGRRRSKIAQHPSHDRRPRKTSWASEPT